jgi:hypothetical protein
MKIDRLEINDSRSAGEDRETANRENQDVAHDAICAITVVTAMPVANTKVRAKIRKIVFMIRLSSRAATLPEQAAASVMAVTEARFGGWGPAFRKKSWYINRLHTSTRLPTQIR